ncbi:hypothetical protein SESBI_19846 [Sesbania bispinosa]|nr:hypothetical protein SESBI_19846 [Sesbania bispinosa]
MESKHSLNGPSKSSKWPSFKGRLGITQIGTKPGELEAHTWGKRSEEGVHLQDEIEAKEGVHFIRYSTIGYLIAMVYLFTRSNGLSREQGAMVFLFTKSRKGSSMQTPTTSSTESP